MGSSGNDELWGGDEEGKAHYSDADVADYSGLNLPIHVTIVGSGTEADISIGKAPAGGTDSLHSIEKVIGTAGRDVFSFSGVLDSGYALTLDANGGQSQEDMLNFAGMGTGFSYVPDGGDYLLTSRAGDGHAGGGAIRMQNFHTQIVGTAQDDEITDEASGEKHIDGGAGNDVITVGGAAGDAMIRGGEGDDVLTGGDGNDVIIGSLSPGNEANVMSGGDGADYVLSRSHLDTMDGGDGDDYFRIEVGDPWSTLVRGSGGNDYFDLPGSAAYIIFGADDGHDAVSATGANGTGEYAFNLFLEDLAPADVTLIWDVSLGGMGDYLGRSDLAVVIKATGASFFIPQLSGEVWDFNNPLGHYANFLFGLAFDLDPAWAGRNSISRSAASPNMIMPSPTIRPQPPPRWAPMTAPRAMTICAAAGATMRWTAATATIHSTPRAAPTRSWAGRATTSFICSARAPISRSPPIPLAMCWSRI